jgi:hypothetical protein
LLLELSFLWGKGLGRGRLLEWIRLDWKASGLLWRKGFLVGKVGELECWINEWYYEL